MSQETIDYSSLAYWENRYQNEHLEIFEWYQVFEGLKEKIGEYIKTEDKVLHVGCGTSKLAEDLYIDDIKDVTNIDFSEAAIKIMNDRYKDQGVEMKFIKMDVTDMAEFQDESFNVVFDKALMDSVLCGENAIPICEKMVKEVYRVLMKDGYYIIVSNGDEANRKMFFEESMWEYKMLTIEKPSKMVVLEEDNPKNYHYIYILTKKGEVPKEGEQEEGEEGKEEGKEVKDGKDVKEGKDKKEGK